MKISERQSKIPTIVRWPTIALALIPLALAYFDIFGFGSMLKWILYVAMGIGVALGAYLVYLRTKD
jgi:hypothetical protein